MNNSLDFSLLQVIHIDVNTICDGQHASSPPLFDTFIDGAGAFHDDEAVVEIKACER
jgi:hypothetical protein